MGEKTQEIDITVSGPHEEERVFIGDKKIWGEIGYIDGGSFVFVPVIMLEGLTEVRKGEEHTYCKPSSIHLGEEHPIGFGVHAALSHRSYKVVDKKSLGGDPECIVFTLKRVYND